MPPLCYRCETYHTFDVQCRAETKEDKDMAAVETKTVTRKEMREVEVTEKQVTVTLTEKQATAVTAILAKADGFTNDRYDLREVLYGLMDAAPDYSGLRVTWSQFSALHVRPWTD